MVFLVDDERNAFTGFNLKHAEKGIIDSYQEFELEEGIPGWVYENKELYICNDPSFDNLFSDEFDKRFNTKSETIMAYPLITDDIVVGVLRVYNKKAGGEFSKADGLLLRELSDIATQIILNTNYFENHSNFFTQAIKLLVIALEAHDEYFKLHSDSVTTYVDKMAEVLDLSLDDSLSLHFAAIFHDIGKLRIDSKILTKETPLTQIEKKRMSLHSIAGEELLKGIKIFNNSTELIRHHHEWYNGTGFPDGLTGDTIPFGSRIIHICEAYDSMTSLYLPHRTPLDTDEACQELRSYSGAQFDPELVEVFITKVLNQ
jgi:HD-GYP domain-containing protein (c-di-GMP phosphodiesterase class II)